MSFDQTDAGGVIAGTILWSVYGIFGGQDAREFRLTVEGAESGCKTSLTAARTP